jgi:uncharacterized damage-inducible protein DinB
MPPGDLPSRVPRWCRQHLGHEPVELGVNHEILHHGQLIVCANALGRAFPTSWAAFGL